MIKPKILAIIPARLGSKRLKHKNFRLFCGKPLFYWTIEQAINSKFITKTIFTSDSKKILKKIKKKKKLILSLRPKSLSKDRTDIKKVIVHEIKKNNCYLFEYIILLQPTSPLRTTKFIDNCIKKMILDKKKMTGISFVRCPIKIKNIYSLKSNNLKKLEINKKKHQNNFYVPSGDIYISKLKYYLKNKTFYSKKTETFISKLYSDIDYLKDFKIAEMEMKQHVL